MCCVFLGMSMMIMKKKSEESQQSVQKCWPTNGPEMLAKKWSRNRPKKCPEIRPNKVREICEQMFGNFGQQMVWKTWPTNGLEKMDNTWSRKFGQRMVRAIWPTHGPQQLANKWPRQKTSKTKIGQNRPRWEL